MIPAQRKVFVFPRTVMQHEDQPLLVQSSFTKRFFGARSRESDIRTCLIHGGEPLRPLALKLLFLIRHWAARAIDAPQGSKSIALRGRLST
jgi:hypothetical protein